MNSELRQYHANLLGHADAMEYMARRFIGLDVLETFAIGYSGDSKFSEYSRRIMFPVHNEQGVCVGYQARLLYHEPERPKYFHGKLEKAEYVCGLWELSQRIVDFGAVVLVEGHFDMFAYYQAGGVPAVPLLGTSLSTRQALILRRYTEVVIGGFDSDSAGKKAGERVVEVCAKAGLKYYQPLRHREAVKDAAEVWQKYGAAGMRRYNAYAQRIVAEAY